MVQTRPWVRLMLLCLLLFEHFGLDGGTDTAQKRLDSDLFRASEDGNVLAVQAALAKGANISSHNDGRRDSGFTALHYAARAGQFEVVQELLEQGADMEAREEYGMTPLHCAVDAGHLEVSRLLLEKGADVAARDEYGSMPLHVAAEGGQLEVSRLLLEKGADVAARDEYRSTPLHCAADWGHLEVSRLLLEKGADVAARNRRGSTPLHCAADSGYLEESRLLLEKGADVAAHDRRGRTPLHCAADGGHLEVSRLLLEKGADVAAHDRRGSTPLHCAANGGHLEVSRLLLEKGADVAARDEYSSTPLHLAVRHRHLEEVRLLLERDAELEARNAGGKTPLFLAAEVGGPIMRLLLAKGADPHARDEAGFCAGEQPEVQKHPARIELLPCSRSGLDWLSHAAASPRFWAALALAALLSYGSARWLGGPQSGYEPEAPLGARLLAAQTVYSSGALLAVQLYRALEILSNTALPMFMMLRLSPALWTCVLLLLYALAAVTTSSACSYSRRQRLLSAEGLKALLLQRPLLLLAASRHSLLRLGCWDRQLLGLLWAPGRLLLLLALFRALAPPSMHKHSHPHPHRCAWCNARGEEALLVTGWSEERDLCLPLPLRVSAPLQTLLWQRWRPPWEITEGNCTRDDDSDSDTAYCIQSPHFPKNYSAGENCRIAVPQPATFRMDTHTFHIYYHFEPPEITMDRFLIGPIPFLGGKGPPHTVPTHDIEWEVDASSDGERGWLVCPGKQICFSVWSVGAIWRFLEGTAAKNTAIVYAVSSMLLLAVASLMRAFRRRSCDSEEVVVVASVTAEILATIKDHPAPEPAAMAVSQIKGRGGRCVKPTSVSQVAFFLLLDLLLDLNTVRVLLLSDNYMFAAIIAAASIGSTLMELQHGGLSEVWKAIAETKRTGVPTAAYLAIMGDEKGEACVSLLLTSYAMAFSVRSPMDLISTSLSLVSSSWSLASYLLQELDIATTAVELGSSTSESSDMESDSSCSDSCSAA